MRRMYSALIGVYRLPRMAQIVSDVKAAIDAKINGGGNPPEVRSDRLSE